MTHDPPDFLEYIIPDFAARPEWSLDHSDDYETFFMYGASEYLLFLDGWCFPDDPTFLARAWQAARSPAGDNEPDLDDGFDAVIAEGCGSTFLDSAVALRQAAWDVGGASEITLSDDWDPQTTRPRVATDVELTSLEPVAIPITAAGLGAAYTRITWDAALELDAASIGVSASAGWAAAVVDDAEARALVVVAWPLIDAWDPDTADATQLGGDLLIAPTGEPAPDEAGCGCSLPRRDRAGGIPAAALLAALLARRRRRQR